MATTKEAMLKFMRETAFFYAAANAYLTAERELCDTVYEELNSLRAPPEKSNKTDGGRNPKEEGGNPSQEGRNQKEEEGNPSQEGRNPNRSQ